MLRRWSIFQTLFAVVAAVPVFASGAPQDATLVVELPADAGLYFFDRPTSQMGAVRTFRVPNLVPGKRYHYDLRAEMNQGGQRLTQSQRVQLAAGKVTQIRFADLKKEAPTGGFVYTINNAVDKNAVIVLQQQADGSLKEIPGSPFDARGRGLTGGDIDEQGAIRVHGNYVLAVNPGSDTIAVFRRQQDGKLMHVQGSPFPSHGNTPLSLTAHGTLVYVANQAAPFANPQSAPNLVAFRMGSNGQLMRIEKSMVEFPAGRGPAQVEFSPNGKLLAVTSGFQEEPESRVHSFVVRQDGTLQKGAGSPATPKGASGVVGFSWNRQSDRVYVSNFRGSAITVFDIDPQTAAIRQMGDAVGDNETAACWTAISPDGSTLYVANFVSNSISAFNINTDGTLKLLGSTKRRGATSADTKDIELSRDGKFLYAVGSGERQVSIFRVGSDHRLTELPESKSPLMLTSGQNITGLATN